MFFGPSGWYEFGLEIWAQFWPTCAYGFLRTFFFCFYSMLPSLLSWNLCVLYPMPFFALVYYILLVKQPLFVSWDMEVNIMKTFHIQKGSTLKFDRWFGLYGILVQKLLFFTIFKSLLYHLLASSWFLGNPNHFGSLSFTLYLSDSLSLLISFFSPLFSPCPCLAAFSRPFCSSCSLHQTLFLSPFWLQFEGFIFPLHLIFHILRAWGEWAKMGFC